MSDLIHVVSKRNNAEHAVCSLDGNSDPALPLTSSSVCVRTSLISLTSNNLSYARGGTLLHWWDAYPVPASLPAPFNNAEEWGIVPAWGYGVVADSTIPAIKTGSLLWGFWPTSSHAVDLQLQPAAPDGHWRETSQHRSKLMSIYNRYTQEVRADAQAMAMKALFAPVCGAAYLLNHAVFSPARPIHPLGAGAPWTAEDADLSSAVLISLSATSKTGRLFAWELVRNRETAGAGPLALLQLTSAPDLLLGYADGKLPIKSAKYNEPNVADWVGGFKPSRVVIVDFGAPAAVLDSLLEEISGISASTTIIAVGSEAKLYSSEELKASMEKGKALGKVQLNTSDLRDRAMEAESPAELFSKLDDAWSRCYKEGGFGNVQVKSLEGVRGPQGIEGAWDDLCGRKVSPAVGLVVSLADAGDIARVTVE